jgi:hypothetical protein
MVFGISADRVDAGGRAGLVNWGEPMANFMTLPGPKRNNLISAWAIKVR